MKGGQLSFCSLCLILCSDTLTESDICAHQILSNSLAQFGSGHISGQVKVSHARMTTLALFFFFWLSSLNEFLSQSLVHSITS